MERAETEEGTELGLALKLALSARAEELGFVRLRVARADALHEEGARLEAWLADGRHGVMKYMAETAAIRRDAAQWLPSVRSVIVLATPYGRSEALQGPAPGRVARYAQGRDYHNVLTRRVRKLEKWLRGAGYKARGGSDSMPLYERAWAQRAGLGFIGKNCCLIIPGIGSYVFLSVVLTDALLPADAPIKERCGACRACLDACPTQAFRGERELDARRCVSYLTIEQPAAMEPSLRRGVGDWLFGCDACQDVCPFNRTAPPPEALTEPFRASTRWAERDAQALLTMSEEDFVRWAEASPLKRAGRVGVARNAAIVLGNGKDRRYLPVLREVAASHDSDVVREAAAWAVDQLEGS